MNASVDLPELVHLPGGVVEIGSTLDEVDRCVDEWGPKLVDPSYTIDVFRRWILKEYPRHERRIDAMWIGRYPITNAQYRAFVARTGAALPESMQLGEAEDCPVWGVSLNDARRYCEWLTQWTGRAHRLPAEHEWEYAARGHSAKNYPFGENFDPACCNTHESGIGRATPVDAHPKGSSELGVFDLSGNVEEWTDSIYAPYPGGEYIEDDLSRVFGGPYPILRGGSFARGGDLARCARRHGPYPAPAFRYTGFRVAAEAARTSA